MIAIYINGQAASKKELKELYKRVKQGKDYITEKNITKAGNISIKTI